jgi:hypothetical protein
MEPRVDTGAGKGMDRESGTEVKSETAERVDKKKQNG